jgi:cyclopropane fatty-acyl-phospholipid synthase-like methyltransferase
VTKSCWPAPERNKAPILEVLSRVLPSAGTLLELASGSGQHAAYFARHLPHLHYLPSDVDPENLASIAEWVREADLPNLLSPRALDVTSVDWNVPPVQAIFNANMLHITPWECAVALFAGMRRHLAEAGVVVLYGPFRIHGAHTASSNQSFDASLRERDPRFGVRDLEAIVELAEGAGLSFTERVEMPANNQTLVFVRRLVSPGTGGAVSG